MKRDSIYVRTFDDQYHNVTNWFVIETDLLASPVLPGYKSGKVKPVSAPVYAKVVANRDSSNSSMGIVKHERDIAPSRLSFTGSTTAGFSGSPYTNGINILGMHMGGGGQGNYGVSASFIVMALRSQRKPESSELLAIQRALRAAKRSDVFVEPTMDDVRIEVNGHFWMIDRSEYDQLLDDERYVDYLLDVDEETHDRILRRNWGARKRDYYDEPDFEPEGNKVEDSFLSKEKPPSDSGGPASTSATDCHNMSISQIQNTMISMQTAISGLREEVEKWRQVCESMLDMQQKQQSSLENRIEMNLTSLKQVLIEQIECSLSRHRCQVTETGTNTSTDSSGPSSQQAQPASASTGNTLQLAMHWDGMDLDLQNYLEWRRSVKVSDPEFVHWRREYLDSVGLTPEQQHALVKRVQNIGKRSNLKARRGPPMPSNSS